MKERPSFDNEVGLGAKYNVRGTAHPEIRGMILHPENFYEPPSIEEWERIEPNRKKCDKIRLHFQQMIEDSIVSDALLLHEQNLELNKGEQFGIDAKKLEQIKQYILSLPSDMDEQELLTKAEVDCGAPLGSLQKIINTVESQEDRLDQIKMSLDKRREQFLEDAKRTVEQESKEMVDPLTGGLSQAGLEDYYYTEIDEWAREKKEDECVLLVAFDIDSFKIVNDELGHAVGDKVLQQIIAILKKGTPELRGLRISDGIGRRSGDEFILILQTKKEKQMVAALLQRITDLIQSVDNPLGGKIGVSGGAYKMDYEEAGKLSYKQASEKADNAGNWAKIHHPGSLQMFYEEMVDEKVEDLSPAEQEKWIEQRIKRAKRRQFNKLHLALRKAENLGDQGEIKEIEGLIDLANEAVSKEKELQLAMVKQGIV